MSWITLENVEACRICGGQDLRRVLDLGRYPYGDAFQNTKGEAKSQVVSPLILVRCSNCRLLQLPPDTNYKDQYLDYLYVTSATNNLDNYYSILVDECISLMQHAADRAKLVLDIGSNDGTLLKKFQDYGYTVVGVEPSTFAASVSRAKGIHTINEFFSSKLSVEFLREFGKCDLISVNYTLANVSDLQDFIQGINLISHDNSFLSIVTGYHIDQFQINMFEYINHDHMVYFSLETLSLFLENFGWKVISAQRIEHKGGSLRILAVPYKNASPIESSVPQILQRERWMRGDQDSAIYEMFARVESAKNFVNNLVSAYPNEDIIGIGASISSTQLVNYFGIEKRISYLFDDDPRKAGLFSPIAGTPVKRLKEIGGFTGKLAIILAWQHTDGLLRRLNEESFHGLVLIPLPEPRILKF